MDRREECLNNSSKRKSKSKATTMGLNPCIWELVDERENDEK